MKVTDIKNFQNIVTDYYKANKRDLPWRNTNDSYEILVSEIMLQQTQVNRVIAKYAEWLTLFPSVSSLAHASQSAVLTAWSGLGYNRRALALYKTAQIVTENHNGELPMDVDLLKKLPGIGDYTAKAVYTFTTNKPSVFIETNIRAVFIHHFFNDKSQVNDSELLLLIQEALDHMNPREWYYALMDYGSWLKRSINNPSVKSRTYTKQSKFDGSRRQLRGRILKEIAKNESILLDEIYSYSERSRAEVDLIISDLENEGYITRTERSVRFKT